MKTQLQEVYIVWNSKEYVRDTSMSVTTDKLKVYAKCLCDMSFHYLLVGSNKLRNKQIDARLIKATCAPQYGDSTSNIYSVFTVILY